jgi:hypothetical protein
MAQVVSISEFEGVDNPKYNGVQKIKWVWVATDAGVVAASTVTGENPTTTFKYSGEIARLVTIPGAGALAPSDNYGVTILDEDGVDVLMGGGLLRDTANTEQVLGSSLGICQYTTLSLRIAAAGDANGGTVILYIK